METGRLLPLGCFQCVKVNNLKAIHNFLAELFTQHHVVFSVSKLII